MKRIIRNLLIALALIVAVLGGTIAVSSYKARNPPQVGVLELRRHCGGKWVWVSGYVKAVNGADFVINGSGFNGTLGGHEWEAVVWVDDSHAKQHPTPSVGDRVRVRGNAVCEEETGGMFVFMNGHPGRVDPPEGVKVGLVEAELINLGQ